jgi:flagellar export protein FliJ
MFKFRLQRLLDLRERAEREKAVELVRAEAAAEAARAALANLEAVRTIGRERMHAAHGGDGTVGQLRNLAFVLEQLDRQLLTAQASVTEAEQQSALVRQDLSEAHQGRRVLDRLRERHEADWRGAAEHADRQTMDGIALARFTQAAATTPRRTA